jgi:hypothetical protein
MLFQLIDVLQDQETLLPATVCDLPCSVVHTNEADFNPQLTEHIVKHAYKARAAQCAAITLGRLPAKTVLFGGPYFLLRVGNDVAQESLPHAMRFDPALIDKEIIAANIMQAADLAEECVLLTRFGHGTWGHWLGEIVPQAALIERRYPRRFRYAVPQYGNISYRTASQASLDAYGIGADRIIPIPMDKPHVLMNALIVTPVWSDYAPHPAAIDVMRGAVRLAPYRSGWEKVALMRRDWRTRTISNGDEVEEFLRAEGFKITDAAVLPFLDQVRMFQSASIVFGVMGSGLTGLIYSPNGVRILVGGPAGWGDRFFYALAQHRRAKWSEVRGPSHAENDAPVRTASFELSIPALRTGLMKLADSELAA